MNGSKPDMKHIISIEDTAWWDDLLDGIFGARKGGARIIIDAEDASTGAGKTGLAISLAKKLAKGFGYKLQNEDMTLSGAAYLQRWREHPGPEQPSVIILDEAAGAGAANARRAMSTQNVQLVKAWQLMRKKRIVSILTLPQWSLLDKSMRKQADYRLWCLRKPIGYFRPYKVRTSFDEGEVFTQGYFDVNRIRFPNLDKEQDPHYTYLASKKDQLLNSSSFDADDFETDNKETKDPEEASRDTKIEIAQNLRESDMTLKEVGAAVGMSDSWVAKYTDRPQEATAD